MKYINELKEILTEDREFMGLLNTVSSLNLKQWCVGAGVIRNIVWSKLHGRQRATDRDIDVVFYDKLGSFRDEKELEKKLLEMNPEIPWEATNQALVHIWYEQEFGFPVAPLSSLEDAISTWPETATCIGAYLDNDNQLEIIAPYGLEDLFSIILRRNPKRITKEIFEKRILQKNMIVKWPKMVIARD